MQKIVILLSLIAICGSVGAKETLERKWKKIGVNAEGASVYLDLNSIDPEKVKESIRSRVIQYQDECFIALHDYWTKGQAINPRYRDPITRKVLPNGLTKDQQEAVKALHQQLTQRVPHKQQTKLAIKLWSCVKAKFGVGYKEVPPEQFSEVISLMSRVALEGEVLPPEPGSSVTLPGPGRYLVTADSSGVIAQDISGYHLVRWDTHEKVRRDLRITSAALNELAERMRVLDGDMPVRLLDQPIRIGINL